MHIKKVLIFIIVLSTVLCSKTKLIPLYIGSEKFTVELAVTIEQKIRGMMFRKSMPDNFGMLFIYDREQELGYWMKNTLINLDIIYLDKSKHIVDMYLNVPPCKTDPCITYISRKPAQYVLELRGNRSKELKLKIGDSVFFIIDE